MKRLALLAALLTGTAAANEEPPSTPEELAEAGTAAEAEPDAPALTARGRYNLGLSQLAMDETEAAAEQFLAARDGAGPDPELRYRAAFNLGLALAAGVAADAPPEEAIETLRQSAAWFSDAVRLAPPDDEDARINLELVSRRILELADQVNDGKRLEARLDRVIDDQRGIRDQVRRLLSEVAAEDAAAEPLGFKSDFDGLASRERMLMAEVADCIDLAAEERLFIEQAPEDQRTPEQQARIYQLAGLTDHLERARQSLSDARRRLRRLEGERGHRRADAALAELKRAREQLLDPVTVLKAVARDEQELIGHTGAAATFAQGGIRLEATQPAWLTDEHLAQRQEGIAARTGGVLGGFDAVLAASEQSADGDSKADARLLRAVTAATPILEDGLDAMRNAIAALAAGDPAAAFPKQNQALEALRRAIEQFAGIKDLIELAYAAQQGIVALLTPDDDSPTAALATGARVAAVSGLAGENARRLERLRVLIEEEAAAIGTEAQEAQDEQAQEAAQERYRVAETLRTQAAAELETLAGEVDRIANDGDPTAARTASGETLAALEDLRRLFFSIVEHLRDLHAQQSRSHDQTATLQFESSADLGEGLAAELGLAADRQARHGPVADTLAAALVAQADAAGSQNASPDGAADAQARQQALATAAEEVRKAGGRMHSASAALAAAVGRAAAMSPELEPALEDQLAAIEHLENALQALTPPDQNQQDGDSQQQAQQQQSSPPTEDEQMSRRQALKRLQAIRDREAQRQRRRQSEQVRPEPVEKDW